MNKQYLRPLCGTLMVGIAALMQCAFAGTSTWKAGSTGGWGDPNSWEGDVPGSSSTVQVPNNVDLPVTDDDVSYVSAVEAIELGSGARIVFNLESSDCDVNGTITGAGSIVKNGSGTTLHLKSETKDGYLTTGGMRVNAGTLECPQTFPKDYSSERMSIGPLHVETGARFTPYAKYRTTTVSSLTGGGTVAHTVAGGGFWPFRISTANRTTFEGKISGYLKLGIAGPIDLTSIANDYHDGTTFNPGADVGIAKFGNRDGTSSSIGSGYRTYAGNPRKYSDPTFVGTCAVRYLGTGERTDKHFILGNTSLTVDAGATGGLTLAGKIYQSEANQSVLTLSGSNTVASAIAGAWEDSESNSTYIAKSGTGTWILYGATNRFNAGVVGVEEGTLQFDSLTETNIPCSFGLSTRLAQKYIGGWNSAKTADYAILLGSEDSEGVLEYIGTNLWDNSSSTRPIAVTGKGGRIVSSVLGRRIGLRGAFAADAGGGTLTLAGNGTTNYLYNVSDGHGKMSLVKEGSGTWVLAGDQTFSGKLAVNEGEVVVTATACKKYSWYRFTITRNYGDIVNYTDKQIRIYELALYDADGNRVDRNMTEATANTIPEAGQVCYWGKAFTAGQLPKLFDGQVGSGNTYSCNISGAQPSPSKPETWVRIVMRPGDDRASAAYYDLVCQGTQTLPYNPNAWTMEASADGVFWDTVANVTSNDTEYAAKTWVSDNTNANNSNTTAVRKPSHPNFVFGLDKGKSLISGTPDQLTNATVSVASGAVLRAEGDVTIRALEGSAAGIGTIDGFMIASDGTFNLVGVNRLTDAVSVAVDFVNVTGAENITGWKLMVGGQHANGRVSYANGRIKVTPIGTMFTIR